jgi:hypothetical protein
MLNRVLQDVPTQSPIDEALQAVATPPQDTNAVPVNPSFSTASSITMCDTVTARNRRRAVEIVPSGPTDSDQSSQEVSPSRSAREMPPPALPAHAKKTKAMALQLQSSPEVLPESMYKLPPAAIPAKRKPFQTEGGTKVAQGVQTERKSLYRSPAIIGLNELATENEDEAIDVRQRKVKLRSPVDTVLTPSALASNAGGRVEGNPQGTSDEPPTGTGQDGAQPDSAMVDTENAEAASGSEETSEDVAEADRSMTFATFEDTNANEPAPSATVPTSSSSYSDLMKQFKVRNGKSQASSSPGSGEKATSSTTESTTQAALPQRSSMRMAVKKSSTGTNDEPQTKPRARRSTPSQQKRKSTTAKPQVDPAVPKEVKKTSPTKTPASISTTSNEEATGESRPQRQRRKTSETIRRVC